MIKALFLVFSLIPIFVCAQTDIPCNIEIVRIANQNAANLTENDCLGFLMSIDSSCENNAEYVEFSNGTLFKILESNSLILIMTIEKNQKNLHLNLIYTMIQDPLHDGFDLRNIKNKILELNYESSIKVDIIKSLDIAITKSI